MLLVAVVPYFFISHRLMFEIDLQVMAPSACFNMALHFVVHAVQACDLQDYYYYFFLTTALLLCNLFNLCGRLMLSV